MKKFLWTAVLICVPAASWAAQIDITTYYDVPDGDFKELTVTGNSQLATDSGNVTMAAGGGFTSIGPAATGPQPLVVQGNLNNLVTASFLDAAGNGVNLGGANGGTYGVVQARNAAGAEILLRLNSAGGSVAAGGNYAAPAGALQISDAAGGNGSLGITRDGDTGEVRVAWATGGGADGYYATYSS